MMLTQVEQRFWHRYPKSLISKCTVSMLSVAIATGTASAFSGGHSEGVAEMPFSGKLVDMIGSLYGGDGITLQSSETFSHAAHFTGDSLDAFGALSLAFRDLSFPVVNAQAGVRFVYDPILDDFVQDRRTEGVSAFALDAATIEEGAFSVSLFYATRSFDRLSGQDLSSLTVDLQHLDVGDPGPSSPCIGGPPGACYEFERDIVRLALDIELKEQMFGFSAAYGVSDRMDVAVFLPVLVTDFSVTSRAMVIQNPTAEFFPRHLHAFDEAVDLPNQNLSAQKTGIGDIVMRANYLLTTPNSEGWSVLAGADVRLPTGRQSNLQGLPGVGVKSRLVVSKRFNALGGIINPRANASYGFDAGADREDAFEYAIGGTYSYQWDDNSKSLSVAADFLGKHYSRKDNDLGTARYDFSTGINLRAFDGLSLYYHILLPLNDNGLRASEQHIFGLQAFF